MANPDSIEGYAAQTEYVWDMGVRMVGTAGPVTTTRQVVYQTHAPRCFKVVTWRSVSIGDFAKMPDPDTQSPNEVLLSKRIGTPMPGQFQDGKKIVTVEGTYTYGLLRPPSDVDSLAMGRYPYGTLTADDGRLSLTNDFEEDIIDAPDVSSRFVAFPFDNNGKLLVGSDQPFGQKLP